MELVTVNPNILGGTPVFPGTRVPVESLFAYLQRGRTVAEFLTQFPSVTAPQVQALIESAKQHVLMGERRA